MKKYYLHDGQHNIGPFDLTELRERGITKSTSVWYEGLTDWTTADTIPELQSLFAVTPPPFPKKQPPVTKKSSFTIYQKVGLLLLLLLVGGYFYTNSNHDNVPKRFVSGYDVEEEAIPVDEVKMGVRNSITKLITVGTNKYSVGAFGGISNLDVIVANNTDYIINTCKVEVQYIQENGAVFESEVITFHNIPAHQDESLSAPDSVRGLTVITKIIAMESTELNLCYDGTVAPEIGNPDPFLCK